MTAREMNKAGRPTAADDGNHQISEDLEDERKSAPAKSSDVRATRSVRNIQDPDYKDPSRMIPKDHLGDQTGKTKSLTSVETELAEAAADEATGR